MENKRTFKQWMSNARSASLVQSAMPAILAVILAAGKDGFNIILAIVAVLGVLAAHLAINLLDDLFDYKADMLADRINVVRKGFKAFTAKYPYLTDGSASVKDLQTAIAGFGATAIVCGIAVALFRGWSVLAIAALTAFLGFFYSAPPIRFCYWGMGELVTGLIFGPLLMAGVHIASCGTVDPQIIAISIPVGLLVTNILFTHSFIDNAGDDASGKVTLAGLLKSTAANLAMSAVLNFLPFVVVVAAVAAWGLPWPYLFVLLALPRAIWLYWSLVKFAKGEEIPLEHPHKWLGNMGDWETYGKLGIRWFLIRWLTARNLLSQYCLMIIVVRVILIFV